MINQYENELKALKEKMEKAEKFADKLPLFATQIIKNKLTGDEQYYNYGSRYKSIPLNWGINRGFYQSGTARYMTNNDKEHQGYFFSIYINSLTLFSEYTNFGLYKAMSNVDIYYIDHINTTFYVLDEHIENFLETLNSWYEKAKNELQEYRKQKEIKELKEKLEQLNKNGA